jgi:drug/metabolite transporter (DMT)-like permease
MKPLHLVELLVLAAIWGASFIFMRVAVPEFGPIPLIGIRCLLAALVLFPVFLARKPLSLLWLNKRHILFIGTFNSALPFTLFAFATLHLSAGFTAIINATVSILTAVIAYFWLKESLTLPRALGLLAGFGGVVALVVSTGSLDESSTATAVLAGLGASFSYGVSACYIRRNLQGIDSLTLSLSSLVAASLVLLPLTIGYWPETMPSTNSWINAVILAGLCTGLAYILYFRLIRHIGSSSTASVTLLIPLFGMMWGVVLLDEVVTFKMILAALLIIAGTAISSGIINPKAWIKHIQ